MKRKIYNLPNTGFAIRNHQLSIINHQFFFPSFTIAELMVAMVVLIIMLGMTGMIYKSASDAVNHSNATTELYQTAEAMRRQLQADISGIVQDSVLVIARVDYSGLKEIKPDGTVVATGLQARADKMVVISSGDFTSFLDTSAKSNVARILYGHGYSDSVYGEAAGNNTIVNRWIFARKLLLYIPGYSAPSGADFDKEDVVVTDDDTGEPMTLAQDLKAFNPNDALGASLSVGDGDDPDIFLLNCGSVRIRILVPANDDGDGILEIGELDASKPVTWLELQPSSYWAFRVGSDTMPRALEFTVRLYDRDLTVTSFDEDLGKEHAGKTFRFLIRIND